VQGPARFARQAGWLVVAIALALLARYGTPLARGVAVASAFLCLSLGVTLWLVGRRRALSGSDDVRRLVRQVILPTDAGVGAKALRAAGLVERFGEDGASTSAALARFHLDRVIEGASLARVEQAAGRRALRYRLLGGGLALAILGASLLASREIAEGFDVLVTRGPRAPVPMSWTDQLRIMAQPPAYLRLPPRRLMGGTSSMLPKGTSLTLRARPLQEGRSLVISDGQREFAFVDDGEGGLVSHYTVEADASLVVAARFGDVLIPEPEALDIVALNDEAPRVLLEEAPKTLKLSELSRLELRWAASDDHGIKQVDLVLRSGTREERRVLATYDDEGAYQRGGHVLLSSDPFLRSLYLPASVRVEAKDNDPVDGSKWGHSEAFNIEPTAVGEPDASRYLALTRARDRFVDALAELEPASEPEAQAERFTRRLASAVSEFEAALNANYGGLRVPPGLRTFALGRLRALNFQHGPPASRSAAVGELILAVDAALASLSTRDAQRVSKVLAEVADEAMVGAQQARAAEAGPQGLERLDRAIFALRAGATQLLALGTLGNDLGSVALADLGRVQRGRDQTDYYHAELAARHLADRLRRPTPSFGAASSGGVEAGQSGSGGEPSGHPSQAEQRFDELAHQIAELAREHSGAVEQVDQTLSEAQAHADDPALRAEAERRASQLRDSVEGLPEPGNSPGTPEAAAALGREHARAMAHNMESLKLEEAAEGGRRALNSLAEALNKPGGDPRLGGEAEAARAAIEEQLRWVDSEVQKGQAAARDKSRGALQGPAALEEELAGAAAGLATRGENEATPLPSEVTERLKQADQLMRQAARALQGGEGEAGLALQRQAQRLLENADQGKTTDPEPSDADQEASDEEEASGKAAGFGGDVPAPSEQNKAEEFRRRVLKSLGDSSTGRLAPAIKRYAEGLLR
jgi:hypothetical protein